MQLQRPEQTPIRAALATVFLRGVDESRDASPPGAGSGAPAGQAKRRLTPPPLRPHTIGQRPAASGQRPAA